MMLTVIAALIRSLPRIFDWGLAPIALALLLLGFSRRTRPGAASGFVAMTILSGLLLCIAAGFVAYVAWRFRDVALDLSLNVGPLETFKVLIIPLLRGAGVQPVDLVPMGATTAGSIVAAVTLRRLHNRPQHRNP